VNEQRQFMVTVPGAGDGDGVGDGAGDGGPEGMTMVPGEAMEVNYRINLVAQCPGNGQWSNSHFMHIITANGND